MNASSDTFAALALAGYLAGVLYRARERQLVDMLAGEAGFFKWAAALAAVLAVTDRLGPARAPAVGLVYAALLIRSSDQLDTIFKQLRGA